MLRSSRLKIEKIFAASTILEAKKELYQCAIDLIILDLSLPDSSGIDSFLSIQAIVHNTPVIILSANSDEEIALEAIKCGAQDFFAERGSYLKSFM